MNGVGFVNIQAVINTDNIKQTVEELAERVLTHETAVNINVQYRKASPEEEERVLDCPPWEVPVGSFFVPPPKYASSQDASGEEVWTTFEC